MKHLLAITFSFIIGWGFAQRYLSDQGGFSVDQKEGCAPLTVTFLEEGLFRALYLQLQGWHNPGCGQHAHAHIYSTGYLCIKSHCTRPVFDQITITVNASTQPDYEISSCNGNQVSIKVTTTQYDSYLVDFDNNSVVDATILKGENQSAISAPYGSSGLKTISVKGITSMPTMSTAQHDFKTLRPYQFWFPLI